MNIIKFAASYFRQYSKLIIILCLFSTIFMVVFLLYRVEIEVVLYASLLCVSVGLIVLGIDFTFSYKTHLRLIELKKNQFIDPHNLPVPKKIIERDYSELIEVLYNEKQKIINEHNQTKRDTEEYYTLWVHQIKSPVAAMRLLLQSEDNPQNAELLLELFKIEQYVEMVLSYIRIESDTSDFVITRFPLDKIIQSAIHKYAPMFVRKKLGLDLHEIKYDVLTDEKWFTFVIEQILSNALKYTDIGKITIYINDNVFIIEDSGIGIAAEDLPRIGEKGFTGYNGRYDKKATGIGLFLCKTVCKKLGHHFTIESQIGVGTKVSIDLDSILPIIE